MLVEAEIGMCVLRGGLVLICWDLIAMPLWRGGEVKAACFGGRGGG